MSMRDYAVNDYGLLINEELVKVIASKACDGYTEEEYNEDPFGFAYELYDKGIVEYVGDFTGEAISINDDGTNNWGVSEHYNADVIYYIPTRNISTLFKAAYKNMDEMITEFKERLREYLPADFDYRKHICNISGTYYG